MHEVTRMTLAMLSMCRRVMMFFRPNNSRAGTASVTTIAKPLKMAPATKYGGKMRRVPAGQLRDGEVEAHHAMHREHQRRGQGGQDHVGLFVNVPVAVAAPPAEGEDAVEIKRQLRFRPVAERGQVRHHAQVPEQERDRHVGAHREHVPQQRAEEVGPDGHLVGIGEDPVDNPHAADVDAGEQARADHGEDRHRLGKAVDARPPFLPEEEQNGRDQRARVPDADPKDEVRNVERPADRAVEVPDADAREEQVEDHQAQDADEASARWPWRYTRPWADAGPRPRRPPSR